MERNVFRILDANLNRARESLRVLEDHARMVLDDPALCEQIKGIRHALASAVRAFGAEALLAARDTPGDVGTTISTTAERHRAGGEDVARAAAKRAGEALRSIEEYGKIVSPTAAASVEAARYSIYSIEQAMFLGSPRRRRLAAARLHVLVTAELCRGSWEIAAQGALDGGADVIQLREKALSDRELLLRARRLREMTRSCGALLIINDRPDIAVLADADGVHLGQDDLSEDEARRLVGPMRLVGATVHSEEEARSALAGCGDYLGVGPMFASPTKPAVPVNGPELVQRVHAIVRRAGRSIPIVVIGGITLENASGLADGFRGLDQMTEFDVDRSNAGSVPIGFAVCQAVIGANDPKSVAGRLRSAIQGQ